MAVTTMKLLPIWYWISEALTVFVNGFISGLPAGGVGGGIALTSTQSGDSSFWTALIITAGNAAKHVVLWHNNGHPVPNPFPKPTEDKATTIV